MPNIPNVPGVPALSSYSAASFILMTGDLLRALLGPLITRWGIFLSGVPVISYESMATFDFTQDFTISEYPVEQGGFQSYNKVQQPSVIKCRLTCGGDASRRQAFLASIDAQMNTTELYDVLTPEGVYIGFNFTHRDFRRTADQGNGLITVDLHLKEVRITATATYTNTQQPGIAGGQGLGNVQPQAVESSTSNAVTAGVQ